MNRDEELELANKELEVELGDIYLRLSKNLGVIFSLKYNGKIYDEAKTKFKSIKEKDISNEVKEKAARIFDVFILINKVYVNEIGDGKMVPTNEDLNLLKKNCQEVLENIDAVNKHYPHIISDSKCSEAKEGIKATQELIPVARKFADIHDRYKNLNPENFSWQKVEKLYNNVEQEASISRPTWLSKFVENQKMHFFGEITLMILAGIEEVNKGGDIPPNIYPSTSQELNFLQKIADEAPKIIDWAEKTYAADKMENKEEEIKKFKELNEKLKIFIRQQRKKLGSSSTTKPNPHDQQKISNQQKEIDYLKQQLVELQNQIAELKKNQNTQDQTTNPETQQKIANLENKKQQIQSELAKKQSQQKQLKDKVNSQQSNNEFNWLYVVVPGAILLVIMGIVIAYLVGKKNKKE